jgi:hypothetical protein
MWPHNCILINRIVRGVPRDQWKQILAEEYNYRLVGKCTIEIVDKQMPHHKEKWVMKTLPNFAVTSSTPGDSMTFKMEEIRAFILVGTKNGVHPKTTPGEFLLNIYLELIAEKELLSSEHKKLVDGTAEKELLEE